MNLVALLPYFVVAGGGLAVMLADAAFPTRTKGHLAFLTQIVLVAAGIVLGTLSLHTGSIWCGWLIHVSVALSMDWLAMLQTAGYPGNPRFVVPR